MLIAKLVSEHYLCSEVLSFSTDRGLHKKLGHGSRCASRCKHPIPSTVGSRVYHKDFTLRASFARPHNMGTMNVDRFLGNVRDSPFTYDLHRWLVTGQCCMPSLVTHERVSSDGKNAECRMGDTEAGVVSTSAIICGPTSHHAPTPGQHTLPQ